MDVPGSRVTTAWRYALVGGGASIPFTAWLYWESGAGSELSLNMVFFGGLLAGYLATAAAAEVDGATVGFRAGVVGGAPGLLLVADLLVAAAAWGRPLWFRLVAVTMLAVGFTLLLLGFAGVVGLIGGKAGSWLAKRTRGGRPAAVRS